MSQGHFFRYGLYFVRKLLKRTKFALSRLSHRVPEYIHMLVFQLVLLIPKNGARELGSWEKKRVGGREMRGPRSFTFPFVLFSFISMKSERTWVLLFHCVLILKFQTQETIVFCFFDCSCQYFEKVFMYEMGFFSSS